MSKLIWISDLHFTATGDVLGHDPRIRLQAAIDHINNHHADAVYCVISGDLVNRGTKEGYAALAEQLANLSVPILPMVGNHDDRRLLRDHFALPPGAMADFVQYAVPFRDGTALCLDTQETGEDFGTFCDRRLEWLQARLTKLAGPIYIFMHHPPMPLGLPMQDQDRLKDAGPFLDLVAGAGAVKHLFIGHVHRPITGAIRGIPYATMRSVLYQAPPPVPAWDWSTFAPATEAPQIGVLTTEADQIRLQYEEFCSYAVGTTTLGRINSGG